MLLLITYGVHYNTLKLHHWWYDFILLGTHSHSTATLRQPQHKAIANAVYLPSWQYYIHMQLHVWIWCILLWSNVASWFIAMCGRHRLVAFICLNYLLATIYGVKTLISPSGRLALLINFYWMCLIDLLAIRLRYWLYCHYCHIT